MFNTRFLVSNNPSFVTQDSSFPTQFLVAFNAKIHLIVFALLDLEVEMASFSIHNFSFLIHNFPFLMPKFIIAFALLDLEVEMAGEPIIELAGLDIQRRFELQPHPTCKIHHISCKTPRL